MLKLNEEEKGDQQETPRAATLEEEEQTPKELPECPNHRPTSFLKGKPPEHSKSPSVLQNITRVLYD